MSGVAGDLVPILGRARRFADEGVEGGVHSIVMGQPSITPSAFCRFFYSSTITLATRSTFDQLD